jgi:hypothetical protein
MAGEKHAIMIAVLTVFSHEFCLRFVSSRSQKIVRSLAIVVEAAKNLNRANFLLKSKAKKFDGLTVGFRPSAEKLLRIKTARYDALRESSGSERSDQPTIVTLDVNNA